MRPDRPVPVPGHLRFPYGPPGALPIAAQLLPQYPPPGQEFSNATGSRNYFFWQSLWVLPQSFQHASITLTKPCRTSCQEPLSTVIPWAAWLEWSKPRLIPVEQMSPLQTWGLWQELRVGADRYPSPQARFYAEALSQNRNWFFVAVAMSVGGLLVCVGSYALLKPDSSRAGPGQAYDYFSGSFLPERPLRSSLPDIPPVIAVLINTQKRI